MNELLRLAIRIEETEARLNELRIELVELKDKARQVLLGDQGVSRREKEVLDLIRCGMGNKEISNTLHISVRTVKFHVSGLLKKFDLHSRRDLP